MAEKSTKRRREVERIEDWDDARYSHVPPRAAADERLTLVHLRVLILIGKVNTLQGWCQLSQKTAADLFGMHRKTVNAAVTDLVAWRYIERRTQAETKTSFCHYRVLIDEPEDVEGVPPTDGTPPGGGVPPTDGTCVTSGSYTGVTLEAAPPTLYPRAREIRDQRSLPQPHGASATGLKTEISDLKGKAETLIARLRADRAPDGPVEHLLRPILEQRRFSAADRHAELLRLARSAKALPSPALRKAAEIVLGLGFATIKPQRIAAAIEQVRKGGAMVPIRRGTAQWQRWAEHFETSDPRQAAVMARQDTWQVPSEWPPRSGLTPLDAAPARAEHGSAMTAADDSRKPSAPAPSAPSSNGRDAA